MPRTTKTKLSEVADIRSSNVDKKTAPGEQPVRLCNYMDVYSNEYITNQIDFMQASASAAEIARFKVAKGDVLLTKDSETPDDIGIAAVATDEINDLICGYHLALLKPDPDKVDPVFLSKQLGSQDSVLHFRKRANGSTRFGLTYHSLAETPIKLFPLSQQRRIAKILSTVDEAIEQTEALIAKTQQIKAGLMQDLFTRGVWTQTELNRGDHRGLPAEASAKVGKLRPTRQQAPHLYKESPLGWIPKDWDVSILADQCNISSGFTLGPHRRPDKNPRPYLRVANVFAENIKLDDIAFLEASDTEFLGKKLEFGDLLVVEGHANIEQIGRCGFVTEEAAGMTYQNHLFRLRPQFLDPKFMLRWMNSPSVRSYWLRTCSTSSGLNTINRTMLGNVPLVVPKTIEQESISKSLESITINLEKDQDEAGKLRLLKTGLMHDLLSGKKPVNAAS